MTDAANKYAALHKAFLVIALDNGGIHRDRSVERQAKEATVFLSKRDSAFLAPIEQWLASLTDDEIETVCAGGRDEPETIELMAKAPPFADDLLNDYFDEVC